MYRLQFGFNDPEVAAAMEALEAARQCFDYAVQPDEIDAAIYDMLAAEARLRAALASARRAKQHGRIGAIVTEVV